MTAFLSVVVGCGDNVRIPSEAGSDAPAGVPYIELPLWPDFNHASETTVAVSEANVVVLAVHQRLPSADSFEFPATLDPNNPFRRITYTTSHDRGETFSTTLPLALPDRGDPVIAADAAGAFWAVGVDPFGSGTDVFQSVDGGATFGYVTSVPIEDKPWFAVDDARQSLWIAGYSHYSLVGFDGVARATADGSTGMSAAFADAAGAHFVTYDSFQPISWDAVTAPTLEGDSLPAGDSANPWTFSAVSAGVTSSAATWIVRAVHDSSGSSIVVHIRPASGVGRDHLISPPGAVGFLPVAALDDQGRLHVVWYDSSGATGQVLYAYSSTADLEGTYSNPIVIDSNACPGGGWYPYAGSVEPFGGRRLREYIGLAISGNRAIVSWTHAPDPPSRVRIAHVDF